MVEDLEGLSNYSPTFCVVLFEKFLFIPEQEEGTEIISEEVKVIP